MDELNQERLGRICLKAELTKDGKDLYLIICREKYHGNNKTPKKHPCECIEICPSTNPGYRLTKDCDFQENF